MPTAGPWFGSNVGLDQVGMPIGAVEGSDLAAQPYVGPLGGMKGYNNNNSPMDGAGAGDLENIINANNYPPTTPIEIS
ncbi:hypothetical protein HDU84_007271 [Entophlyctis sp. JEL0112]|nr:hypothetical protein HDU84_007271 [Entophlyctis sp. JEL0112]